MAYLASNPSLNKIRRYTTSETQNEDLSEKIKTHFLVREYRFFIKEQKEH